VAVLEQGKWVKNGFSMRDMQFTELRNVSRDIMREAFGISKTMLGQTEDVNRATAEAAEVVFGRWHLVPRLERIKGALNETFLPMFGTTGSGLEFDYENPVPESIEQTNADRDSRISGAVALVGAGWAPDQALEVMGLPPMDFVGRAEAPSVSEEEMEPVG
jgi:phage portal protein BeeE